MQLELSTIPLYVLVPAFALAFAVLWVFCRITSKNQFAITAKFLGMEINISANDNKEKRNVSKV